jgi:hypothetical protein
MHTRTAAISLELSMDGDSLTGSASDEAGARKEFSGWLGLISAIEALIPSESEGDDQ